MATGGARAHPVSFLGSFQAQFLLVFVYLVSIDSVVNRDLLFHLVRCLDISKEGPVPAQRHANYEAGLGPVLFPAGGTGRHTLEIGKHASFAEERSAETASEDGESRESDSEHPVTRVSPAAAEGPPGPVRSVLGRLHPELLAAETAARRATRPGRPRTLLPTEVERGSGALASHLRSEGERVPGPSRSYQSRSLVKIPAAFLPQSGSSSAVKGASAVASHRRPRQVGSSPLSELPAAPSPVSGFLPSDIPLRSGSPPLAGTALTPPPPPPSATLQGSAEYGIPSRPSSPPLPDIAHSPPAPPPSPTLSSSSEYEIPSRPISPHLDSTALPPPPPPPSLTPSSSSVSSNSEYDIPSRPSSPPLPDIAHSPPAPPPSPTFPRSPEYDIPSHPRSPALSGVAPPPPHLAFRDTPPSSVPSVPAELSSHSLRNPTSALSVPRSRKGGNASSRKGSPQIPSDDGSSHRSSGRAVDEVDVPRPDAGPFSSPHSKPSGAGQLAEQDGDGGADALASRIPISVQLGVGPEGSLGSVTKIANIPGFGVARSFSRRAFRLQKACRGQHDSFMMRPELPSKSGSLCTFENLLQNSKSVSEILGPPRMRSRVRPTIQKWKGSVYAKILRRALRNELGEKRRRPEDVSTIIRGVFNRRRGLSKQLNIVGITYLMCQAALPEEVAQAGKFLAAAEPVPANPAMSYLDAQGAWVTMPDRSALGEGLDATGYTAEGNAQQRATMASLAKVFQLILRLVKLSDHYLRERDKQATSYFPKPWIVDTIAATRLTEYVPVHTSDNEINPLAAAVLQDNRMALERSDSSSKYNAVAKTSQSPSTPENVLPSVFADRCYRNASFQHQVVSPFAAILTRDPGEDPPSTVSGPLVDVLLLLRDAKLPKEWTLRFMSGARKSPLLSDNRAVLWHEGIDILFEIAVRRELDTLAKELQSKILSRPASAPPLNVLIAGHALGGGVAILSARYLTQALQREVDHGLVNISCVAFGAPAVGNEGAQQLIAKLNCIQFSSAFDALLRAQKIPDSPLVPGPSVKFLLRDLLLSNVKDEKGAVLFRGLAWFLTRSKIEDRSRIQPRHFSVSRALSTNPLVAHTAIYACVTAVLGGLLKDFGWASMCSGNLVNGVYTHSLSDEWDRRLAAAEVKARSVVLPKIELLLDEMSRTTQKKLKMLEQAAVKAEVCDYKYL